jgi:hypothetical protein
MGLSSEGITKVRAFELPAGVWKDGDSVGVPRTVLLSWQSSLQDKFYQVYVNGRYYATSDGAKQRRMLVQLPSSFSSSVHIEVFAVDACEADRDFSSELDESYCKSGRVKISLLRQQKLAAGAMVNIYFDNGTGEIDYDNPINTEPIEVWADWQDKGGFGMSRFGRSDFGRDWSSGAGFGVGCFGWGEFGVDADVIEWISEQLPAGVYKFAVKIIDAEGNESEPIESGEILAEPAARGVEDLSIVSFDESGGKMVLGIN